MSHESISFAREAVHKKLLDHQGSKERPTYSFNVDLNTGMYLSNIGEISLSATGEDVVSFDKNKVTFKKGIVLQDINEADVCNNMLFKKPNDDGLWWRSANGDVRLTLIESVDNLESNKSDVKAELELNKSDVRAELEVYKSDVKAELESAVKAELEANKSDVKAELEVYKSDVKAKLEVYKSDVKAKLEVHKSDVRVELEVYKSDVKAELEANKSAVRAELELNKSDVKAELELNKSDVKAELELNKSDVKAELELNKSDIRAELEVHKSDVKAELEVHKSDVKAELETYANFVNDALTITNDSVIVNKELCISDGEVCGSLYKKPNDHMLYWNTSVGEIPLSNLQMYKMKSLVSLGDCVAVTKDGVEKITCGVWEEKTPLKQVSNYKISKSNDSVTISSDTHSTCISGTYSAVNMVYDESINILVVVLVSSCVEIVLLSDTLQIGYRSLTDLLSGTGNICLCLVPGQIVAIAYSNYKFFILLPSEFNSAFSQGEVFIDNCINCIDICYDVPNGLVVSVDETISNNCCQLFDIIGMQLKLLYVKKLTISTSIQLQLDNSDNYLLYYSTGVVIFKIIDNTIVINMIRSGTGKFTICNSQPSDFIGIVQYVTDVCYVCVKGSICYVDGLDFIGKKIYFGIDCSYDTSPINSNLLIGTCIGKNKILVGF